MLSKKKVENEKERKKHLKKVENGKDNAILFGCFCVCVCDSTDRKSWHDIDTGLRGLRGL